MAPGCTLDAVITKQLLRADIFLSVAPCSVVDEILAADLIILGDNYLVAAAVTEPASSSQWRYSHARSNDTTLLFVNIVEYGASWHVQS
jgi:hypothetical protein